MAVIVFTNGINYIHGGLNKLFLTLNIAVMKKVFKITAIVCSLLIIANTGALNASTQTFSSKKEFPASIGQMKLSEFVKLSVKEFSTLSSKKLNLREKVSFSILKTNMKKYLKKNTDQTVSSYLTSASNKSDVVWLIILILAIVAVFVVAIASKGIF